MCALCAVRPPKCHAGTARREETMKIAKGQQVERELAIRVGNIALAGGLTVPAEARGIILFAHGSGSSRFSPRNQFVARRLQEAELATLLMDLLTPAEEDADATTGHLRFDIGLLSGRLVAATDFLAQDPLTRPLPIGYF